MFGCLDFSGLGPASRAGLKALAMAEYSHDGVLTAKGRLLSHEISRAGMEALPFPIQYPASIDNLPEYQEFCRM